MGCLLFPLEFFVDCIIEGWFYLMVSIVPERCLSRTLRTIIKIFVWIFSILITFIMILGFLAIISPDPETHSVGKYMFFIPLGISAIQIVLGIIVRVITKKKK